MGGLFLIGAVLIAAATTTASLLTRTMPCEYAAPGDVVINEILYDGFGGAEFVEVLNQTDCAIALDALTLSDARGTRERIATSGLLEPGALGILASDGLSFESAFPGVSFLPVDRWPALNNGGDGVVIAFRGTTVDSVYYDGSWGVAGRSIERRHPDRPSTAATSWGPSSDPSGATPGRPNSLFAIDSEPPEIVYAEEEPGNVVYVRLSEPVLATSVTPARFAVGALAPVAVDEGPSLLEYRLRFAFRPDAPDVTSRDLLDLSGNASPEQHVPLAALARPGSLVLNEIMYEPLGSGTASEYVELFNRGKRTLSLRGLRLADAPDDAGLRPSTPVTDERRSVQPNGFVVVYESSGLLPLGAGIPPEFSGFNLVPAPNVVWIPASSLTPRGLANDGQEIALLSVDGGVVDVARYSPDWHSLTLVQTGRTEGTSLERRTGAAQDTWTSSVAVAGGTPGAANSSSTASGGLRSNAGVSVTPSPFSPDEDGVDDVTAIQYRLRNEVALVRIRVFDLSGRAVRVLEEAQLSGATGSIVWDGRDDVGRPLRTGIYIIVVEGIAAETAAVERHRRPVTVVHRR